MSANNSLWERQLVEARQEAASKHERFRMSPDRLDLLDSAQDIYEDCCDAYGLENTNFLKFIQQGKSPRTRLALSYGDLPDECRYNKNSPN